MHELSLVRIGHIISLSPACHLNSYHSHFVVLRLECSFSVRRWASLRDEGLAVMEWAEPGSDPQAAEEVGERRGSGPLRPDSGPRGWLRPYGRGPHSPKSDPTTNADITAATTSSCRLSCDHLGRFLTIYYNPCHAYAPNMG